MERQNQIKPCVEKGSHSKDTYIQHKANKSFKESPPKIKDLDHSFDQRCIILGSYMLCMIVLITLTLSLISCKKEFDPKRRKPINYLPKGCFHKKLEDLRTNPFEDGGDDGIVLAMA